MREVVFRKNRKFMINETELRPECRTPEIINNIYMIIIKEFQGAAENPKYATLPIDEKLKKVNEFAYMYCKQKGYLL